MEGQDLLASRQLQVTSLKEMHIRFSPEGGRYVVGLNNKIYFSSFSKNDEKVPSEVSWARVLVSDLEGKSQTYETVLKNVSSDEEGRGVFEMVLLKDKQYFLEVQQSGLSRRFPLYGKQDLEEKYEEKFSKVQLSVEKRVFKYGETIKGVVRKNKKILANKFDLFLLNKLQVISEEKLKIEKNKKSCEFTIDTTELDSKQGGVFTLQLYRNMVFQTPVQEVLIYIEPEKRLDIGVNFDKEKYCPKGKVNFKLNIEGPGVVAISVSDETAFLEVERRRRPASFATKTFLEKEVYSPAKELACADKYIDWFFQNEEKIARGCLETCERDRTAKLTLLQNKGRGTLERLLAVQDWRKDFLSHSKLKKFKDLKDSDEGTALEYLVPVQKAAIKNFFTPQIRYSGRGLKLGMMMPQAARIGGLKRRSRAPPGNRKNLNKSKLKKKGKVDMEKNQKKTRKGWFKFIDKIYIYHISFFLDKQTEYIVHLLF